MDILSKQQYSAGTSASSRARSLLTIDGTPLQNAEELKQILGNANSRLKSGAIFTPGPFSDSSASRTRRDKAISLEQARSRSRVNLDIFLESDVCVQGGNMQGYIQIRVRKYLKKNCPFLISGGKLRLIGFESIDNGQERSIFYQCSAPLSEIAHGLERLYSSEPDEEGFAASIEGIHLFPFVLHLKPDSERGIAKGVLKAQNGPIIRYVAMLFVTLLSLAIKDSASGKQSIAHFYRDCCIWPRLNPSTVLAPTSRPIRVTTSESLRMGGNGEVKLTASLHRLHWVAGQSCFIGVKIVNNSEKAVKTLFLRLIRSITLFRVGYKFNGTGNEQRNITIADEMQSSTITKEVAQSNLEQDAVSISRSNLLEVSYTLQVTVNMGTILATEVQVSLPIEIINFLSIDPPPEFIPDSISANQLPDSAFDTSSYSEADGREEDSGDEDEGYSSEDNSLDYPDEPTALDIVASRPTVDQDENNVRFADLYYSSLEENLDKQAEQFWDKQHQDASNLGLQASESHSSNPKNTFAVRVRAKHLQRQAAASEDDSSTSGPRDRQTTDASQGNGLSKYLPTEMEASLLPASTLKPSSRLPASNTQGNDLSSVKPCSCAPDPNVSFSPRISHDVPATSDSQLAIWSHVSGVGLRKAIANGHIGKHQQHINPRIRQSQAFEKLSRNLQQSQSMVISKSPTQGAVNPKPVSSPSAPPTGSVKDKIRELEELAAKTLDGA
ncbi:hypothetical protein BJ912DRAFT_919824 [Pholiota molesta]|nr:hypothetical protein BJ912DRAFT_919824 [Pholiota molesta]